MEPLSGDDWRRPPVDACCCFTGHRPKHFSFGTNELDPGCVYIKTFLRETAESLIGKHGVTHFIAGGAMGVDTWAMEEAVALRERHPSVTLELALPYPGREKRYPAKDRLRFEALAHQADRITILGPAYDGRACFDRRDHFMIDHANHVIAVWLGIMTGTGRAMAHAKRNRRIVHLLMAETVEKRVRFGREDADGKIGAKTP